MRMAVTLLRKAGYSVAIATAVAFSCSAPAATLGLPDTPLFLAGGAQPNLIMAIDDSGSMDFEVLLPANDGAAWWRLMAWGTCTSVNNNSFVGCINNADGTSDIPAVGKLNFNNSGESSFNIPSDRDPNNDLQVWRKFVYLFPNGYDDADTSARRRLADNGGHYAIPPIPAYAWSRSSDINAAYFNPAETYDPWVDTDDYTFGNSSPTAARFDPVFGDGVTINLTQDRVGTGSVAPGTSCGNVNAGVEDNHYFRVYRGMTLPAGTCMRRAGESVWETIGSNNCQVGIVGRCDTSLRNIFGQTVSTIATDTSVAIRYYPATFYLKSTTALPDGYGYNRAADTSGRAPDNTALNRYEIKRDNFASQAQYDQAIQNFANWFTYYRKRHQALRAGLGLSFSDIEGIRVDGFTINNRQDVTMGSLDDQAVKRALYRKFYTEWVRSGGTPNRSAVARMISNFKRTDNNAPVTASCQKNFGMLFTDGFSNSPGDGDGISGVYDNVDGNQPAPYKDNYTGSLADAVMSAYLNPLRTDTGFPLGNVGVSIRCPTNGTNVGPLDCNRNLHMNFFAVTLNTRGLQFNPDADPAQDPFTTAPTWPTTFPPRHPSAVDDLWHATLNGRGKLLNARSPKDISRQLSSVLASVVEKQSSAASAAVNAGTITVNSLIYQARFDASDWTGQLLSYGIDPKTGKIDTGTVRDAAGRIPAADSRNIVTLNSEGQAVDFKWINLQTDTTRVAQLDPDSDATEAERILNYVRGDATNEGIGAGQYRQRDSLLGDIVNSAPLYVGAPPFRYRDSLESAPYSAFVTAKKNRPAMTYVGANDGMLHAFYADGGNRGTEAFAYIPGAVFPKLRALASPSYGHQFYVDGSPGMGDAFIDGKWRSVLVGGLNKGGQGVYAIDITDSNSLGRDDVMWEFTDADDVDLGYTYSQPTVVKLRDGKWYAVFGNGYNSRLADGRASTTGSAVLFIVDLGTGEGRKIDTGEGYAQRGEPGNASDQAIAYDNGLATPALIDANGDSVVESAYAGDLYGNLWKFDLSSTDPDDWAVAFGGQPLFKARNDAGQLQPITARPEVARGPGGNGFMVLFGTGKYLELDDKRDDPEFVQSFYGIVDNRIAAVTYTDQRASVLTKQEILVEQFEPRTGPDGTTINNEIRVTTDNPLGANQGWYMDLLSPNGYENEKQVTGAQVRGNRVIFTTLTPETDICGFGGTSWLMELDFRDGSRLEQSPFDLDANGEFNDKDNATTDLNDGQGAQPYPPGGIRRKLEGIMAPPIITTGTFGTEGRPVQYKYMPASSGNIVVIIENPGEDSTGRQSWRQIR